jgi:cytochrome c oxidase subunit 3
MSSRVVEPELQYATLAQQRETARFGLWVFLATEVLFFGGMLAAYMVYRSSYAIGWALAGQHTKIVIGTVNTAVLLTSSLFMALADEAVERGRQRRLLWCLLLTALLGLVFLALKGFEYSEEYAEGLVPGLRFTYAGPDAHAVALFYFLYFTLTGLHAIHLTIGVVVVLIMAFLAWRGRFGPARYAPVAVTGLYWHFVDVVWIFLFPLIYLVGRST